MKKEGIFSTFKNFGNRSSVPEVVISGPKSFQQSVPLNHEEKEKILKSIENYDELKGIDPEDLPPSLKAIIGTNTPEKVVQTRTSVDSKKKNQKRVILQLVAHKDLQIM